MVGIASRILRSSLMTPSRIGTFRSSRSRTRLPCTSMSSMVAFDSAPMVRLEPGDDQADQVDDTAGVAPLVVIPGEHLHRAVAEHLRRGCVEDGRARIRGE